jgi:hypothetical protein
MWLVLLLLVAIGVVLGAAVGALVGDVTYRPCGLNDYSCFDLGRGFDEAFGAVVGAVVGAFAVPILWLLWRAFRGFTANSQSQP